MADQAPAPRYDVPIDFVAGSVGATASVYVGQPLDTIKVKMQTFPELYPRLGQCARHTLAKEGVVRGLYAGTVPSLAANVAENSILFAAYGACQRLVATATGAGSVDLLSVPANGLAGFLAAFWSSLALCPTELVKCRLQAARETGGPRVGPAQLTRQILATDGPAGLFRGLTATFAREMPGYAVFFMAYEASREAWASAQECSKDQVGPMGTVVSGGVAGVALWTAIFPADVVKSRLQVSGATTPLLVKLGQIYSQEGVLALYNGLGPTVLRTFPATGALFLAYEYSKMWMHAVVD